MAELLSNTGYFSLVKEAVKGTAVTPTDSIPLADESLTTMGNFTDQEYIFGNKFATYATIQGQRSHKGDLTVLAEPNTTARLYDALLTRQSTTGSGPYTHRFVLANTVNPNSYTIDISTGNIVKRFFGVEVSSIGVNWNGTELQHKVNVSALGSFQTRIIASVSGQNVTLDTTYDPNPTNGLVAGDLIRFYDVSAGGTNAQYIDATVTSVTNGTTFVASGTLTALTLGDSVHLRPNTVPTYNLLPSFIWPKTIFGFGATATAALANATQTGQTRVEAGSEFTLKHNFESEDGAGRSGGFDPAALVRTTGEADLTIKKFFDRPDDVIAFTQLTKGALVIRHFSTVGTNNYEYRVTFNNVKADEAVGTLKFGDVTYSNIKYHVNYDQTDGIAFAVDIINNLSTI